jgi:hypothetical protein
MFLYEWAVNGMEITSSLFVVPDPAIIAYAF